MIYLLGQIVLFFATAITVKALIGPTSEPNWAITLAYGSLFLPALTRTRQDWHRFVPLLSCFAIWVGAVYYAVTDPDYIASFPYFYVALALVAVLCQKDHISLKSYTFAIISLLIAAYGLGLQFIGFPEVSGAYYYQVGWNLMLAVLVVVSGYKGGERGEEKAAPISDRRQEEYKKAA